MISRTRTNGTVGQVVRTLAPRLAVVAAAVSLIAACEQDAAPTDPSTRSLHAAGPQQGTFYGAAIKVGDGLGRTYFALEGGVVTEVGLALSEAALRGLPAGEGHHGKSHHHQMDQVLRMHPQNPTPYQFVELNWNPNGHPPEGIYDLPHFDVHFYTISVEERNAIDPADPRWEVQAANFPDPAYVPPFYVALSDLAGAPPHAVSVPRMGMHWMDVRSPEFQPGGTFTETFLYGSWDGKVIFVEPMITRAFLETKPNLTRTLPVAQQGYNPGSYRVYWNESTKEYRIALTDLPQQ